MVLKGIFEQKDILRCIREEGTSADRDIGKLVINIAILSNPLREMWN